MAGLSHAVLVIEAEERSGTLITSRLASEYNRDVFTVPHSIYSATGTGPHLLMTLGATPIRSADDLLLALHLDESDMLLPVPTARNTHDMTDLHTRIMDLLREPLTKDVLLTKLQIPAQEVNIAITALELSGRVKNERGTLRAIS
jgi:DNA processing protein